MSASTQFEARAMAPVGGTRLHGRRLVAARVAWLLLFAVALVPFLLALPDYRASITHPSPEDAVLSPGAVKALVSAGISLAAYAWASLGMACLVVLVSVAIALVLAWRRGDDWMALLVSVFLVVYATSNVVLPSGGLSANPRSVSDVAFAVLASQQNVPAAVIPFAVFLLFPSGGFAPRWSGALFVAVTLWAVAIAVLPEVLGGVLFLGYPLIIGAIIVCMIFRYRRASTPVERQQTKWVVAGLVVSLLANQAFWLPSHFTSLGQTLYPPLCYLAYQLVLLLVPVTFFVAIQRYRLYDIDPLINRALVYSSLTAILALVYVVGVIGGQTVVGSFTQAGDQEESPVIIVATTLVIAALFGPLRRRLQRLIDRRFYRRKYDAAKTLASFGTGLRQEVNLRELSDHLLTVVEETMQPTHASLWLRPPDKRGLRP